MKFLKKAVPVLVCLFTAALFVSCATAYDLVGVETADTRSMVSRGSAVLVSEDAKLTVSAAGNGIDEEGEGSFVLSIKNKGNSYFSFYDAQITIYSGDRTTNSWRPLGTWSAESYFANARSKYNSDVFWAEYTAAVNTSDAFWGRTYYNPYTDTYENSYSFTDYLITDMIGQQEVRNVKQSGQSYLNFLQNNLLFSSQIAPGETYAGWVYFDASNSGRNSDYKVVFNDGAKTHEFIFFRVKK